MDRINKEIGTRIGQLRRARGLTQDQLSEELDITTKHMSAVERGVSALSLEKLIQVCEIFDCSLDYLIRGTVYNPLQLLPPTLLAILSSENESEKTLLTQYLEMFIKLRTK